MAEKRKPDFSGWATKYGIKCSDGRTILPGAFADMEGKKVPIVWGHIHDDPDMVLGHAFLFNRPEGIWAEGYLNGGAKAQSTKEALLNEDIDGLSIYANELKHVNGRQVQHGNIRELSVVLAGANKGATIENVLLAHGDLLDELDDEAIVYSDEMPLCHGEEEAEEQKKKKSLPEEEDKDEEPETNEEEEKEKSEDASEEEGNGEDDEVKDKEKLQHADDGGDDERTIKEVWDSMSEEQKNVCYFMIAQATGNGGDDGEEDEEDSAEHSEIEEDDDMKVNVFDRNKTNSHPDDYLSHEDQQAIIARGKSLGSMRAAWKEALESNETLSHSVYNDDGSAQTYGIANIDYLFPDYTEMNATPEMIQRPDEWVGVVLNGVMKTPHARLKTTVANITMEEARAKGYTKGDQKDPEVFNLLHRTVDPQTIYKYQELDQDDVIDITDFDVIAWVKAEMRIMLNEEIARAILIGDGRVYNDKYKIKEAHIKPIVDDDDMYAIKIAVTPGANNDDAATAKNAIRALLKGRKNYKGSGNLVFFTSEDWLCEMLLLEDGFGRELYPDASALAKKLRVNRIVTVPFLEDLTVDNQKVFGIAIDLRDYATGTDRRGKITFFDDFDIEYNKNQYLIETRLSGMIRRPLSAMVLKISTSSYAGPHYDTVTPASGANPKALGYYEHEGDIYRKTTDTSAVTGKTYYTRSTAVPQQESNSGT